MMGISELYSWLEAPWQSLQAHIAGDRIPHALLMQGPTGLGKLALAERFAHELLCSNPEDGPCGACHGCQLFEAGTHPDYQRIGPEEPGKAIKVDAIRKLISDLSLKPQYRGYRVFVIDQAELMNLSSANALLKTLEEPAEKTVLLLIASHPSRLPPTILSRCQKLVIRAPHRQESVRWLDEQRPGCAAEVLLSAACDSPLKALALADTDVAERRQRMFREFAGVARRQLDPVSVSEYWQGESLEECLEWILSWVSDMVRLAMVSVAPRLSNKDLETELTQFARKYPARDLMTFRNELLNHRQALAGQMNRQLLVEEVLIGWLNLARHSS